MASEYEKMIAGGYYRPADPGLRALAQASREKQEAFNQEVDPKKLAIRTNHGILSNRDGTYIQHGQIVIGMEIFSQMDVDPIIHKNLTIEIEVFTG